MGGEGRLGGRVAIVTGAASGIGRAIALAYGDAGARVMASDVDRERGEAAAAAIREAGGEARFVACDVSVPEQVEALVAAAVAEFGGLDVLVNNAGIPGGSLPAHETSIEDWDRVIAVNLRGPFLCAKYAIPHLIAGGRGVIVNIASTFGMIGAHGTAAYSASKGGVITLTKQLAVDYGPRGLRVNAISPGYVDTDMAGRRAAMAPAERSAALARREAAAGLQPLGRQADPGEIGAVAVFLASDDASFMTGAVVPVDGGCTATFNSGSR